MLPDQDRSAEARLFQGGNHALSRNNRQGNATRITANEDTYVLKPHNSSTSSKELIVPLNAVYVRHDFSVLPDPPKVYELPVKGI